MSENKTKPTVASVSRYLAGKATPEQLADCKALVKLFKEVTGKPARMWGSSIVGFDSYHYVYPSGREGDAPLLGFAVRGREIVIYAGLEGVPKQVLKKLGKFKASVSCVYIRKLDDLDRAVLEEVARLSVQKLRERYPAR